LAAVLGLASARFPAGFRQVAFNFLRFPLDKERLKFLLCSNEDATVLKNF
jgi:hypothetical protein